MDGNVLLSECICIRKFYSVLLTVDSALSPTSPFPKERPRLVLASVLIPGVAVSLVTTSAMFVRMTSFGIGVGFFSDPLVWRGLDWLNTNYPNWQKFLEIRK